MLLVKGTQGPQESWMEIRWTIKSFIFDHKSKENISVVPHLAFEIVDHFIDEAGLQKAAENKNGCGEKGNDVWNFSSIKTLIYTHPLSICWLYKVGKIMKFDHFIEKSTEFTNPEDAFVTDILAVVTFGIGKRYPPRHIFQ